MTGHTLNSTHKERNQHSNLNTVDHTWPVKREREPSVIHTAKITQKIELKTTGSEIQSKATVKSVYLLDLCIATAINIYSSRLFSNLANSNVS